MSIAALLSAAAAALVADPRPNLVFLLADDQGWNNSGLNNPTLIGDHTRDVVKEGIKFNRHYVFKFCSPTRSSLMSGRWPIHVNQENSATEQRYAGVPLNMTTMSEKLSAAGYICHHFGKWHIGQATMAHTPAGRGFRTSLSFFNFGEDHFTQLRGGQGLTDGHRDTPTPPRWWGSHEEIATAAGIGPSGVDLWNHTGPAIGQNGTYGGFSFTEQAVAAIHGHDQSRAPFFMFCAFQNMHPPLQVPQAFIDRYPAAMRQGSAGTMNGMATFLDESVGNISAALKATGMWANTLVVYSADNGGYLGNGGDSSPWRGGKFSDFEGGTRVPAFASGGMIPASMRGTETEAMMHIADWYGTFCILAKTDPVDKRAAWAALPPVDSMDLWPLLSGQNGTSPHTEICLSASNGTGLWGVQYFTGGEAIVTTQYKLVVGDMHKGPFGDGTGDPSCTNNSQFPTGTPWNKQGPGVPCQTYNGFLFDLDADPYETTDVSAEHPDIIAALKARMVEYKKGVYAPYRGDIETAAQEQVAKNGGFWGPWLPNPVPWPPHF